MADKRIDQLTAAESLGDSDLLVIEQQNAAKKATGEIVANYINAKFGLDDMASDIGDLQTDVAEKQDALTFPIPVSQGGTGANNAKDALANLGAASSEATDGAIANIKSVFSQAFVTYRDAEFVLEQGGITSNGTEQDNPARVRTSTYIPIEDNILISVSSGVRWATRLYGASNNYLAYYPTDGLWVASSGIIDVAALKAASANATKIRFIFSFATGSITPADVAASVSIAYYRAVDGSLTAAEKAAEASAVGDNLAGARNVINKVMLGDEVSMTWQNGQRGASSGGSADVVGAGTYFSCSSLIDVTPGEIFTLINLRPDKYRFAVRAYTDTPENSGVYISGTSAAKFLKDNLEPSGASATVYSNTTAWVYKNTLTILQNAEASTAKYWSVHARRVSTDSTEGRFRESDLAELQEAFHLYRGAPFVKADFCDPVMRLKVLAAGDSICRGGRNGSRGFVGDIGCAYVNIGIGGATLSTAVDSSSSTDTAHVMGASNIPDTLVKYAARTAESWYIEPDVIIAEGGINDYAKNAPLGTVPTAPARNDTDAAALDLTTVTGGVGYLCYQMVKLFPNAHRFFLLMNRVANKPWTTNTAGYTQTQLNEAIVAVCKLYSVDVIDVFNHSLISSTFSQYVSPTPYREDSSVTDLYYIDADMIHPLALGYRTGYVPLVREALRKAVT